MLISVRNQVLSLEVKKEHFYLNAKFSTENFCVSNMYPFSSYVLDWK